MAARPNLFDDIDSMDALTEDDDEAPTGALDNAPEDDDTVFDREVAARRKTKPRVAAGARVGPAPTRKPRSPREDPAAKPDGLGAALARGLDLDRCRE